MAENRFLTPRLSAILEQVQDCKCLGDVGTDHAYIPIAAVRTDRADFAYATDVHPGPVKKAADNVALYGLSEHISVRLGDGLAPLLDTDVDTVVIAGMGGCLITEILERHFDFASQRRRLILQPMREADVVRTYLADKGFPFTETLVQEDRRFYHILTVFPNEKMTGDAPDEWDLRFGIRWLRHHPLFLAYIAQIAQGLKQIEDSIQGEKAQSLSRKAECRREREFLQELMKNDETAGN